ncbi:hypothetical protein GCM10025883_06980 [Mobilicoccus caccae]|uniref:O-antigen ligase-related domain-containing protein n=1 Tax=Mobilicoccus caccae TaxID=1859295 RepID=A0ABQ6IN67_9MICO|nr:hypothetical protein GCM10025883_06980 [Mobilicoccus caccae]
MLTAGIILMIQAGGLVSNPLYAADLIWPAYLGLLAAGVLLSVRTRVWRSPAVWLFLLFWIVLGAWMPYALDVAPHTRLAEREAVGLGYCAALSVAVLLAGGRAGLRWWRIGWLLGLLLVGGVGVWELVTGDHLWVTPERPFPFRGRVAVATYINPNNFGIVLLSMIVALLAWRATARDRRVRIALVAAAVGAGLLVLASQSRAAVLGLVLVLALEMARVVAARPGLVRDAVTRHLRLTVTALVVVALAVISTFVVPALATRNPILRMIQDAMQPETGQSDLLRVALIRVSLRYLAESGYLGTGAGSFEPIMWNDPNSGIAIDANLHNAFFELLSQYGVVVGAALALVPTLLLVVAWRSRLSARLRPQVAIVRTEMLGHLLVFVALGFTASSSLALPVWWLMLANACACAAALRDRTHGRGTDRGLRDDVDRQAAQSTRLAGAFTPRGRTVPAGEPTARRTPGASRTR